MSKSVVINLAGRFNAAFGAYDKTNLDFAVLSQQDKKYAIEYYGDYDKEADTVVFEYNQQRLTFTDMLIGDNSNIYAPPLLISVSADKNHIETSPADSDDVVVERWSTQPWSLDIRGILIDVENRQFPDAKISELVKLFKHNNIIKVIGKQFYAYDIDSFYIKSVNVTPVEGFQDTVQFNLTAKSIKSVFYNLLKPI